MAKRAKQTYNFSYESSPKLLDPELREQQLVNLAYDLTEQRLRDGTASSQEVVHFLKLGSSKQKLEREKLLNENLLLKAKTENLAAQASAESLVRDAINAFKSYHGEDDSDEYY